MSLYQPDFQLLFESVPGLYLVLLPDLTIVASNDAYLSATMKKREEIVGRQLFDVFPDNPDDSKADGVSNLRASLNFVFKNKAAHTMAVQKYDIRKSDGTFEERFWSPVNKPVFNERKEVVYIIHKVEDVTEFLHSKEQQKRADKTNENLRERVEEMEVEVFKRAQEIQKINNELEQKVLERTTELLANEQKIRSILDNMLEGIQILDFDKRYLYINKSLEKHGRKSKEELLGKTMTEVYPGIEKTGVFEVIEQCLANRHSYQLENEFMYPDGTKACFELSIQPVPEGVFVLSIDITDRKNAQREIQKLNEGLEQRIVERTSQLESLNKELEAFSYSVSHDLRAPLRAIGGYAAIIVDEYKKVLDAEGQRLLAVVCSNVKRMEVMINDLLEFSRVGKREIKKSSVNMCQLAHEVLIELNKTVKHSAKVEIANLDSVLADHSLMSHVFNNLISNAIKYSSKKEKPVVEIRSEKQKEKVVYSVKDNGSGFDMQYAQKLFGVFQRLHDKEEFDGTGVGLAIVQRIVSKHGGQVWAEGKIDKGATFYFSLPVTVSD